MQPQPQPPPEGGGELPPWDPPWKKKSKTIGMAHGHRR